MAEGCPQCRMEKGGYFSRLEKDSSGKEYVCETNPRHRFVMDKDSFFVSVEEK
ncbi:MAG: hypothetical protein QXH30_02860 [Candidatus Bilamarchaeaceae archaeon]